jgi:hypothetical protein
MLLKKLIQRDLDIVAPNVGPRITLVVIKRKELGKSFRAFD